MASLRTYVIGDIMPWAVEYTDEFGRWWESLSAAAQEDVAAVVGALEALGPRLGHPYSSDLRDARYGVLRELRVQHRGRPLRIVYAFAPRRVAVLLLGGDKSGQRRWYAGAIRQAERLYTEHLEQLRREGGSDGAEVE